MVWVYAEDVYRFVPTYTWDRYSEIFDYVWAASAFKGAHGPTLSVPNVKRHLDNNLNWLDLMGAEESKFKGGFRGLVITGWQRYLTFKGKREEERERKAPSRRAIMTICIFNFPSPLLFSIGPISIHSR